MTLQLIYLYANDQQTGPFTIDQLRSMWNSGSVTADTFYWQQGMQEWLPVHTLLYAPPAISLSPSPSLPVAISPKILKAQYDKKTDSFLATMPLMIKLAMRAIQDLGWKLENANETIGLVSFETGISWGSWSGVSCSLNIDEIAENKFRITGTGKQNIRGGQIAAIDFGEAKGKAEKAISKMKELAR